MRIINSGIIFALLGVTLAGSKAGKISKRNDFEYSGHEGASPYGEQELSGGHSGFGDSDVGGGGYKGGGGKGFSIGSGLRSIAQGSADQANSAVANQHAAGKQAAYVAKNTLAQAAVQAAATAHAALAGKEVLLHGLEQQSVEAHHQLESEIVQLQLAKRSAKAAQQAAHVALNHVSVLTAALNGAQGVAEHAEETAHEAASELASQTGMVGKAKARLEALEHQLKSARVDYEATREAAEKASASAQEAQNNAAQAAAHATIELHESAVAIGHGGSAGIGLSHEGSHGGEEIASNHNYEY